MTLNDFAGWAGYGLALTGIAAAGLFLVAAGGGFAGGRSSRDWPHGPAVGSAAIFGGVTRHDQKMHHSTPHML